MERLLFTLSPQTAFGTPLAGDTLFGQCCWAIRHLFGDDKLSQLLVAYTKNQPFMVIADAMPQGFLPRPTLPAELLGFDTRDTAQRKQQKGQKWLPESVLAMPLSEWAQAALTETQMLNAMGLTGRYLINDSPQDHNSLNRQSGSTGKGDGFAPFQRQTFWYHPDSKLSLIIELDVNRLSIAELLEALQWIGLHGYGKEASCGLGKFEIELAPTQSNPATVKHPNAWLTLAPCVPQDLSWHRERCYYQVLTRFGRHGDMAVHQNGGVFKNPVLMAATGAVLTPKADYHAQGFTGQGITGVSKTINATVHQGYAPVYPVEMTL